MIPQQLLFAAVVISLETKLTSIIITCSEAASQEILNITKAE